MEKKQSKRVLTLFLFCLLETPREYRSRNVFPSVEAHQVQLVVNKKIAYISSPAELFHGSGIFQSAIELIRNLLKNRVNQVLPVVTGTVTGLTSPVTRSVWDTILSNLKPMVFPFLGIDKFVKMSSYIFQRVSPVPPVPSAGLCLPSNTVAFSSGVALGYSTKVVKVNMPNISVPFRLSWSDPSNQEVQVYAQEADKAKKMLDTCHREKAIQNNEVLSIKSELHQSEMTLQDTQHKLKTKIQTQKKLNDYLTNIEMDSTESRKGQDRKEIFQDCEHGLDIVKRLSPVGVVTGVGYRCASYAESLYSAWADRWYTYVVGTVLAELALYQLYYAFQTAQIPRVVPITPIVAAVQGIDHRVMMSPARALVSPVSEGGVYLETGRARDAVRDLVSVLGASSDNVRRSVADGILRLGVENLPKLGLENVPAYSARGMSDYPQTPRTPHRTHRSGNTVSSTSNTPRSGGTASSTRSQIVSVTSTQMDALLSAGWRQKETGPRFVVSDDMDPIFRPSLSEVGSSEAGARFSEEPSATKSL